MLLQAQMETTSDEMCAMKEHIFKLQNQLANPGEAGTHIHYHDERCVIVIQNVPMDLAGIQEPIPLMWFTGGHLLGIRDCRLHPLVILTNLRDCYNVSHTRCMPAATPGQMVSQQG